VDKFHFDLHHAALSTHIPVFPAEVRRTKLSG
jgi:hypothetical protein